MLLQPRYVQTIASGSSDTRRLPPPYDADDHVYREEYLAKDGDGWSLNRFYLRVGAEPAEWVRFRSILDFAKLSGGGTVLKQAYVSLRPIPRRVELAVGLFKRPYSILELDPAAEFELSETGFADELAKELDFAGRDVGAEVMLAPLPKKKHLTLLLGAFQGNSKDEHASPIGAIGARAETRPVKGLRVGADLVVHPFDRTYRRPFETSSKDALPDPPDLRYPSQRDRGAGKAWSADVTFVRWRLTLKTEGMLGTRVDVNTRGAAGTWAAAWALAAYRFPAGPLHLMPAARVEWLDADREHDVGTRLSYTLGLNVIFSDGVRLLFDVTRTEVDPASPVLDPPLPLAQPGFEFFELDRTRITGQLQVEI